MELNGFLDEIQNFFLCVGDGDTAGKIGYMRSETAFAFFHNNCVSHVNPLVASTPPASPHNGIIRWFIKKEKQQGSLLALYPHREYDTSLSENLTALAVTGTPVRGTL
jgi:hypothetical protein